MEVQLTETMLEEENPIFSKCMEDLITLLKKKFIQSMGFGCYLAKAKEKEKFIDELSLAGVVFIQCIHALLNEDYVLGGITAEILQSDRKFYKELKLYSADFEFWVHQNFKFAGFQIKNALEISFKIRNSGLYLTPRSVYRILSVFVDRVKLRPHVRDKLYIARKTQVDQKEEDDKTDIGENVIAITSVKEEYDGKRCAKILFVKKEKGPNINKIKRNDNWVIIQSKYQELLKPKVLGALEFACTSSIYEKEFTLKYMENPMKRLYFMWLWGLVNRDHILFSLACNCLAFAVNDKNNFPPDGFNKWITTNFIFTRNKLLAGARFLKKIKSLEFFYILPELEETFVNLSFIETNPLEKLNLKAVVEGKWKKSRTKRVKKEVMKDKINIKDQMKEFPSSHGCLETNSSYQVHLDSLDNARFSDQSSVQQPYFCTEPVANQGYYQPFQSTMYIEGNGFVPLSAYNFEESSINYNTIINESETMVNPSLQNQICNLPLNHPIVTDSNASHLSIHQTLSKEELKLAPVHEGTAQPVQSQRLKTPQNIPEPPPPPILSTGHSPKFCHGSQSVSDNNVDSILNWLEEKNKVVQEAMIKSVEAGHLEDLTKLAGAGGLDLLRKTRKTSSGETLLHIAAREDHESTVEFLVGHGGLDTKDNLGRTPLHLAVLHGRVTIVEILLESGASSSIRDDQGKTPHDLAVDLGKKRLADKILKLST